MKISHILKLFILFTIIASEEKIADINILKGMDFKDFIDNELLGKDTIKITKEDKIKSQNDRKLIQNQNQFPVNQGMQPLYYQSVAPMMQPIMTRPMYPQMVPQAYQNPQQYIQPGQQNNLNLQAQPIIKNGQAYYPMVKKNDVKIDENVNLNKKKVPIKKKKLKEVSEDNELKNIKKEIKNKKKKVKKKKEN